MKLKKPNKSTEAPSGAPSLASLCPGAVCGSLTHRMAAASFERRTRFHAGGYIGESEMGIARVTCPIGFNADDAQQIRSDLAKLGLFPQFQTGAPVSFFVFAEAARNR